MSMLRGCAAWYNARGYMTQITFRSIQMPKDCVHARPHAFPHPRHPLERGTPWKEDTRVPRDRVQPAAHLTRDRSRVSACRVEKGCSRRSSPSTFAHVAQRVTFVAVHERRMSRRTFCCGSRFQASQSSRFIATHTRARAQGESEEKWILDLRLIRITKLSRVYEYPFQSFLCYSRTYHAPFQ